MSLETDEEISAVFDEHLTRLSEDLSVTSLLLAVSGGSDSMALMHLASTWAVQRKLTCSIITIDHDLRIESAREANFVKSAAEALGLKHNTVRWEGWDHKGNLQMYAREARYRLIDQNRGQHRIVLTGHTNDDQAETFLLHLRRGSGVDGLAAMRAKRKVTGSNGGFWLLRPMLGLSRDKLKLFLKRQKISWIDDPTNEDTQFDRIEIRKAIQQLNGLGITTFLLSKTASHMQRAQAALDMHTGRLARQICSTQMGDLLINRSGFLDLHDELRYRLFASALRWVSSNPYKPRFDSLIATLEQILIGKAQTLHGCYIHPKSEHIRISRELNAVANKRIPLSNGILWDNRWKLECPDTQIGSFCHVAALGLTGARWVRERTDTLIPYKSLQSHPGIYDESGLRCAPSLIANSQIVATFCAIPFQESFQAY